MRSNRPIIGIPSDVKQLGPHPFHCVGDKYIQAVARAAGAQPILIPALGASVESGFDVADILSLVDGLLFTGSYSNVAPQLYGSTLHAPELAEYLDPHRDATTIPLIRAAFAAGVPVFGICRGFQELNVAFGGTLHQAVHEIDGFFDHREDKSLTLDQQYAPAHSIHIASQGLLHRLSGQLEAEVNSLHGQGINQLGSGLTVEARAPDGLIEAFSIVNAQTFALAVQWHPEWQVMDNPLSLKLFAAFGQACAQRSANRLQTPPKIP